VRWVETSPLVLGDPLKENVEKEQYAEHFSMFLHLASEHSARFTKPGDSLLYSQQPESGPYHEPSEFGRVLLTHI
jgi:hypothetical protein